MTATAEPWAEHRGMRVRPDTNDARIVDEVFGRTYERKRVGFRPEPGEVWADLGAHIGSFSVMYAPVVEKIYAYEPDPDTFALLRANTDQHRNVWPYQIAITDSTGTAEFTVRRHMSSRNTLFRAGRWKKVDDTFRVKTASGANLPYDVTCIKADVEGAERGLLDVLPFERIRKFVVEWSFDVWPELGDYRAAVALLEDAFDHVKANSYHSADDRWQPNWFPPCALVFAWDD